MREKLARRLADVDSPDADLLDDLISDAGFFIMNFTGRDSVPSALEGAQLQLAAVLFNRMGAEGEISRDEGGVARQMELLPEDIAAQLKPWRLARAVRA